MKDESSSESDKDFQPSDGSEEELPRVTKRKRAGRKKASSDEEEMSDVTATSEDSDVGIESLVEDVVVIELNFRMSRKIRGERA